MDRRSILRILLVATLAALQPVIASGVTIIPGVTATTDMGSLNEVTTPDKMVDGSGLTRANFTSFAGTHDSFDITGWKSPVDTTSGTITFDLHGLHLLDSFGVWNHPQLDGTRGVHNVFVFISTDGVVFTDLAGAPTSFAQKTYPVSAEVFDFADVLATHVRFQVIDGYGAVNTGLSKVRFSGTEVLTPVPEPGVFLPLGTGLVGLLSYGWRRQRMERPRRRQA